MALRTRSGDNCWGSWERIVPSAALRKTSRLCVRNPRTGLVSHPDLGKIFVGQWTDFRVLHDHARTGIPSQNGIVVSRRSNFDGFLIVGHRLPEGVICGRACSGAAFANPRMPHALPDKAGVIGLFVVTLN